jgi:hypothetical protein
VFCATCTPASKPCDKARRERQEGAVSHYAQHQLTAVINRHVVPDNAVTTMTPGPILTLLPMKEGP